MLLFGDVESRNIVFGFWIVVNKVDMKLDRREKNIFKSIGRKKIDGRMRTLIVIKALNIFKKEKCKSVSLE